MKVLTIQTRARYVALAAGALAFAFVFLATLRGDEVRFDKKVRNDYFAGLSGDKEAMARGLAASEAALKENPNHAEALVWHGAGLFSQAGLAFRAGDQDKGMELFTKALAEMDHAVELQPNTIGVRIPRGAAYLKATPFMPDEVGRPLLEKGISDYERALELQKDRLDKIGEHPRGELLYGLGEAYTRSGDAAKAQALLERVAREMKGTVYATRANKWLETKKLTPVDASCVGCHIE